METASISIAAAFGAILTVIIKFFDAIRSWRSSRNKDHLIKKEIDYALKEIEFINNWLLATNNTSSGKERDIRHETALKHLDNLMTNYQNYCSPKKTAQIAVETSKSDGWFYAMSSFFILLVLSIFVDENDKWALSNVQENLNTDSLLALSVFFLIWIYFLINSKLYKNYITTP